MATPAYIAIFHQNKPIPGPVSLHDHEGEEGKKSCTPVLELAHRVWTVKDYWEYCIHYYSRAHDDFSVTIPLTAIAPQLYQFFSHQTFLPKIEVYQYKYNKKARKELEYFRETMEHVLISRIRLISPNIKTPGFERYDPMLELAFRYQRITWLYTKGYIIYTDEWDQAFDPGEQRDFSNKDDALYEAPVPLAPFKLNPRKLKIIEPEAGLEPGKPFETSFDGLLTAFQRIKTSAWSGSHSGQNTRAKYAKCTLPKTRKSTTKAMLQSDRPACPKTLTGKTTRINPQTNRSNTCGGRRVNTWTGILKGKR